MKKRQLHKEPTAYLGIGLVAGALAPVLAAAFPAHAGVITAAASALAVITGGTGFALRERGDR